MRVSGALMVMSGPLDMGNVIAVVMAKVGDAGKGQAVVYDAQTDAWTRICAKTYLQFAAWLQNGSRAAQSWLQGALYACRLSKRAT